jgi:hypothetical protein
VQSLAQLALRRPEIGSSRTCDRSMWLLTPSGSEDALKTEVPKTSMAGRRTLFAAAPALFPIADLVQRGRKDSDVAPQSTIHRYARVSDPRSSLTSLSPLFNLTAVGRLCTPAYDMLTPKRYLIDAARYAFFSPPLRLALSSPRLLSPCSTSRTTWICRKPMLLILLIEHEP